MSPLEYHVLIRVKRDSILSVHVLWAFVISSAVFLCVLFTVIGQMDPVIVHYNSTGLTGPRSPYTLGSGLSWCCDKNLQGPLLNQSQSPDEVQPPEGASP